MSVLRVGVLGFGFIGTIHSKAVAACPGMELAGVWTLPDQTAESFRKLFPSGRLYGSPEEMAADRSVDAVAIGTPNAFHWPQAKLFLEAGKHVLVEKPMAMTVAEAEAMADLACQKRLRLMVGHMWRFDREVRSVRDLVASGEIGEVVKTKGYGIHENWGPSGWFSSKELAGGGALVDMGVHALDTVRFLLGDPVPSSVYAMVQTRYGAYDVDDTGILLVTWSDGVTSLVESGWWQPHMDGPEASTQVFGTQGYARVFPTMAKFKGGKAPWVPKFPQRLEHCEQPMYDAQMAEFGAAITEGRDPVPGAEEGLTVLRICEAAYASAARNEVIRL
jgi:predicted dehydrogenase